MAKLRTKLNKADESFIKENSTKNSIEISEEIGLDQLVVAEFLKKVRASEMMNPARLKSQDGQVVGATLTEAMASYIPTKTDHTGLDAPHIFRKKNQNKE